MFMLSSAVLRLLLLCVISAARDPAEMKEMKEVKEMKVRPGQDATLECEAHTSASVTLLEWYRPDLQSDDYVFFYRYGRSYENYLHARYRGRAALRDPEMTDGDVSVVLKNVSVNDTATYMCRVIAITTGRNETTQSEINCFVHLEVTDHTAGNEDEGNKNLNVQLIIVPSVVVVLILLFIGVVAVLIRRKYEKNHIYKRPAGNAGEPVT